MELRRPGGWGFFSTSNRNRSGLRSSVVGSMVGTTQRSHSSTASNAALPAANRPCCHVVSTNGVKSGPSMMILGRNRNPSTGASHSSPNARNDAALITKMFWASKKRSPAD